MDSRTRRTLMVLACALAAAPAWAAERSFDRQFSAPPGGELTVDSDTGTVLVAGAAGGEVIVHAEMSGSDDFLSHLAIRAQQDAHGISVSGRLERRGWFGPWFAFGQQRVLYTIEVPRGYPVEIRTAGGSIDVGHLQAAVHARTSGGSIQVTDTAGELNVRTSGGSIHLEGIDGAVRAVTSGGSVRAEMRANRGVTLATSGGSIVLWLPVSASGSIDARTSGGRVRSGISLSRTQFASRNELRGDINGGGEPIFLRTSGGSIRVDALD